MDGSSCHRDWGDWCECGARHREDHCVGCRDRLARYSHHTSSKPSFTIEVSGDHVHLRWKWDGLSQWVDALEFLVDRGSGYTHLVTDTTPNYIDGTPLPATPQKWTYKAIFKLGDARIGQWSDEGSITIGG
jgi:hypothetical protein